MVLSNAKMGWENSICLGNLAQNKNKNKNKHSSSYHEVSWLLTLNTWRFTSGCEAVRGRSCFLEKWPLSLRTILAWACFFGRMNPDDRGKTAWKPSLGMTCHLRKYLIYVMMYPNVSFFSNPTYIKPWFGWCWDFSVNFPEIFKFLEIPPPLFSEAESWALSILITADKTSTSFSKKNPPTKIDSIFPLYAKNSCQFCSTAQSCMHF